MKRLASGLTLGLALVGLSCVVNPDDYAGRGCDTDADCLDGRVCRSNLCVTPQSSSSGCVRWTQLNDGFASQAICAGCTLAVNADTGNSLTSTIIGPEEAQSFAYGAFPLTGFDGFGAQGKLRGRIRVSPEVDLNGTSAFLRVLATEGGPFLELAFDNNNALRCLSAAGTLSSAAVGTAFSSARFPPGNVYALEIRWKRGDSRVVTVDGVEILRSVLDPVADGAEPSELRLGIQANPGGRDDGWTGSFFDWELCNDPAAAW